MPPAAAAGGQGATLGSDGGLVREANGRDNLPPVVSILGSLGEGQAPARNAAPPCAALLALRQASSRSR